MNVFELFATLTLNTEGFSQGLQGAKREAEDASSGIGGAFSSVAAVAGKAILAGTAAVASGVTALTGSAVSSYGTYQQLVGGAQLMFADASDTVLQNAADAYATMSLSQNEYLSQANMFATGLTNALGGDAQAAADLVNDIMQAEADIVASTGQDMELVQNAFNGIMRNNYVMLDNLGLGIAPTKEGMQEVIDTVNAYNEAQGEATNYTIDNLADQEAALVQYIEMQGLSGWASMEAGETITGSIGAVGAAWENLVTGLADPNADLGELISRFITAGEAALENLLPIIEQALLGIGDLVDQIAPIIQQKLPTLIGDLLPPILRAAVSLVSALVAALPTILSAINQTVPILLNELLPAIIEMLPDLVDAALELVVGLANALSAAAPILIPAAVDAVLQIVETLTSPENLELLINAAITLAGALAEGILMALPQIIETLPTILVNLTAGIISMIPSITATVIEVIGSVIQSAMGAVYESGGALVQSMYNVGESMMSNFGNAIEGIRGIVDAILGYITDGLGEGASNALMNAYNTIVDFGSSALDYALGFANFVIDAFNSAWQSAQDDLQNFFNFITSGFSNLDISLPHIDLPHFSISGGLSIDPPSVPSISIDWYAKAMNQPRLLNNATIFGAAGGSLLGGGEAGGELVVGWDQLKKELGSSQPVIDVHVYIGGTEVDDFVVDSSQRNDFISGGRG